MDDFPLAKRMGYFATAGVEIPLALFTKAVVEYVQFAVKNVALRQR